MFRVMNTWLNLIGWSMKFYVEIKRYPSLRNTFRTTSPSSLSKMRGELFSILATAEKENELRAVEDYHRNNVISELEYDEFVNLYLQIYCPDVNYRVTVGPKLFSIQEIMVGWKLRRVEAFGKESESTRLDKNLKFLKMLWPECVHKLLMWFSNPSPDFKGIVKSHIHFDIEVSGFDDIIKLFLSGSKSEFDRLNRFNKLKSLMFHRLYTV